MSADGLVKGEDGKHRCWWQGNDALYAGYHDAEWGRPVTDEEYNARRADNQRRIDEILEKISRGGYESLTKEEKEFLFHSSRKS